MLCVISNFEDLRWNAECTIKGLVIAPPVRGGGGGGGRRYNLSDPLWLCDILIICSYWQSIFIVPHLYSISND